VGNATNHSPRLHIDHGGWRVDVLLLCATISLEVHFHKWRQNAGNCTPPTLHHSVELAASSIRKSGGIRPPVATMDNMLNCAIPWSVIGMCMCRYSSKPALRRDFRKSMHFN
jgi:hypothetical protein